MGPYYLMLKDENTALNEIRKMILSLEVVYPGGATMSASLDEGKRCEEDDSQWMVELSQKQPSFPVSEIGHVVASFSGLLLEINVDVTMDYIEDWVGRLDEVGVYLLPIVFTHRVCKATSFLFFFKVSWFNFSKSERDDITDQIRRALTKEECDLPAKFTITLDTILSPLSLAKTCLTNAGLSGLLG